MNKLIYEVNIQRVNFKLEKNLSFCMNRKANPGTAVNECIPFGLAFIMTVEPVNPGFKCQAIKQFIITVVFLSA